MPLRGQRINMEKQWTTSSAPALIDSTVAAASGTASHHVAPYDHHCTGRRRRRRAPVGRARSLAAGCAPLPLALVRRPLGGVVVPQLAASPHLQCTSRANRGARRDVVCRGHRARPRHGSHCESSRLPAGTMAGMVAGRVRVHCPRTSRASRVAATRPTKFLQWAGLDIYEC